MLFPACFALGWAITRRSFTPNIVFYSQCYHMSFVDFVVLPPGHGRSVTDFWGWDAHEAQLRCPDGVWMVIEEDVVPGGALNIGSTNLPRPWSPRESSPSRKIPTVEPEIEPGTSWLVVKRLQPLDHEAGHVTLCKLIVTDVSEETVVSIFRVAQLVNGGCKPFCKVDKFLPVYTSSYPRNINIRSNFT